MNSKPRYVGGYLLKSALSKNPSDISFKYNKSFNFNKNTNLSQLSSFTTRLHSTHIAYFCWPVGVKLIPEHFYFFTSVKY